MRVTAAVASCIGVGLVLQGCGDGESNETGSCLAKKMDIVSQTMSGTTEVSIDVTANGDKIPTPTQTADFKVKIDFDKFNIWEEVTGTDPSGENVVQTTIISIEKKQAILYVDAPGLKNCTIQDIPDDVADQVPILFPTAKLAITGKAECGGNDGTLDTWKFTFQNYTGDLPTGDLPIPDLPPPLQNISLDGLNIKDGSVGEDVKMSADHLLHSSTTHVSGELLNHTETMGSLKMQVAVTVKDVTKGGPTEEDLDPSQFKGVTCKKGPPSDILPGFAHKQFLRYVKAAKNSEHALVV